MTPPDVPLSSARRSRRVSLEAVAHEAGVSVSTASRALSGLPVRPVLLQRVQDAARGLGYKPDLAAQAVARGATKTVALIVDYLRSPFGVEITRGVVDAASTRDLVVNVTGSETHPGDLLEMIAGARALRPRALVLATGRVQDPSIRFELVRALRAYQSSGGSVAIVDGLDLPFASCAFDETTAARALGDALARLGYRRPLVFNASAERADLAGRTHALIEGLELAGVDPDAIRLAELPTEISRSAADDELLELGDADVVLCVEGAVVPAVYRHIRSRGMRVGADVAVTAFGQYGFASALRPHLTTVMLPLRRAGELALEHALSDIDGAHLALPCNLRIRASSPRRIVAVTTARAGVSVHPAAGRVGVILPDLPAEETGVAVSALFELARADGRRCDVVTEASVLDGSDRSNGYGALLVWGPVSADLAQYVRDTSLLCVSVGEPSDLPVAQLAVEIAEGMQRLLEHLHALGHTRVAYLAGKEGDSAEGQRRRGIELFEATHEDVVIVVVDGMAESVDPGALELQLAEGASAVVAHDDVTGARVIRLLAGTGRAVPGAVSVAGFGGGPASELSTPAMTTVRVDNAAVARSAWRLLSAGAMPGEVRSLQAALVVRASTGMAPAP